MEKLLKDFRDFVMRGNVLDLAVAVVIGVAFNAVVNSLVNDILMQIIAAIFGEPNFNDLTFTIKAWLTMRSRDNYRYSLRLESALGPSENPPIKSYLVEKVSEGSSVRWITQAGRRCRLTFVSPASVRAWRSEVRQWPRAR